MNTSNLEHGAYAFLIQIPFGLFGFWWTGAFIAIAFFLGREHAQAEKRITNGGHVDGINPLAGFDIRDWPMDARLDLAVPAGVVVLAAMLASL